MTEGRERVTASHLRRDAYLYVRQSTLRQVLENTESTQRQYALRQRAVALGWPTEQVTVIDSDLGQSGASAADREGFQRLVTEVGLGHAGIVLGLEVSRLARNCSDWHRLLELCALTDTLILDEDELYNPNHFNDRLVLGLKGAMSEAELHLLRLRLQGGIRNKADRGELRNPLPVGLVYDGQGRVALDPDRQVQQALSSLFAAYERTGSASATVKHFRREGLLFPRRLRSGPNRGDLVWGPLGHTRALQVLHNPRYAGAFVHGRYRGRRTPEGRESARRLPQDQWQVLLPGAHPGYITWDQFQRNQRRLSEYAQAHGLDRRHSPPGQGPALLQGLVVCGACGRRMTVRYHQRPGGLSADYVCQADGIEQAQKICQSIPGVEVDRAVGALLLELISPLTLEVALAVQEELQARLAEADRLRQMQVERARYEAELARVRYLHVDPRNRFVAEALEADWNEKLRAVREAEETYQRQRQEDRAGLDEVDRRRILDLVRDFTRLWCDPGTPDRERKRMVRLLIEDITLIKAAGIRADIRLKGGATRTLILPRPRRAWELRQTDRAIVEAIDRWLDDQTDGPIASRLDAEGYRSGGGRRFTARIVARIRRDYGLISRYNRLRARGLLTLSELAGRLEICTKTVQAWQRAGLVRAQVYNDKNECLYEILDGDRPVKHQGRKLSERRRFPEVFPDGTHEVQDES
jgi:DNA invertase Pin-like site-specific DNA recombinase